MGYYHSYTLPPEEIHRRCYLIDLLRVDPPTEEDRAAVNPLHRYAYEIDKYADDGLDPNALRSMLEQSGAFDVEDKHVNKIYFFPPKGEKASPAATKFRPDAVAFLPASQQAHHQAPPRQRPDYETAQALVRQAAENHVRKQPIRYQPMPGPAYQISRPRTLRKVMDYRSLDEVPYKADLTQFVKPPKVRSVRKGSSGEILIDETENQ